MQRSKPNWTNRLVIGGAIVLAVIGVAYTVLVSGAALRRIVTEYEPTRMTCDKYLRRRPTTEWVRLTQCRIDATSPAYEHGRYGIGAIWIFARTLRSDGDEPAPIVFRTEDSRLRDLLGGTLARPNDDMAWERTADRNAAFLWRLGELEGIVVPAHVYVGATSMQARAALSAESSIYIAESTSPFLFEELQPAMIAGLLLVIVGAMASYTVRQRRRRAAYQRQQAAAAPTHDGPAERW